MPRHSLRAVCVFLAFASGIGPPTQAVAADSQCFTATNFCIQGRFLDYWRAHGGLAIHGHPLTTEYMERLEDGKTYTVQYFERARFEYHPENPAPYTVLLGQVGRLVRPAAPPFRRIECSSNFRCFYFHSSFR